MPITLATDDTPAIGTLTMQARCVYGKTNYYPACKQSEGLARLLGQTSFTTQNIKHLLAMGYQIDYTHPDLSLQPEY